MFLHFSSAWIQTEVTEIPIMHKSCLCCTVPKEYQAALSETYSSPSYFGNLQNRDAVSHLLTNHPINCSHQEISNWGFTELEELEIDFEEQGAFPLVEWKK